MTAAQFEAWARDEFRRRFPGQKPLNWRIGQMAESFSDSRPMGRFVLHKNDCSDFTHSVLDEALGPGARRSRHSAYHMLAFDERLWEFHSWQPGDALQPGDEIAVRHSPNYPPVEGAPWHRGIIGTDGRVYDWTRLVSWSSDRYGCHTVEWFTRYSHGPRQVIVRRLKAAYRYRIQPIPQDQVPFAPEEDIPQGAS
jgi:hypothetical protein